MSVGNDIASRPDSTRADVDCPECDEPMWDIGTETVCGSCSMVFGAGDTDTESSSIWDRFDESRPTHWNSDRPRCVGGFAWTYDWVSSDDIDGPVRDVAASEFYR